MEQEMDPEETDSLRAAFEVYRYAWAHVVSRYRGSQPVEIEQLVDELKEALLDLKQATIDVDPARTARYVKEVLYLLTELQDKPPKG
jgi:ribosomal protein L29